MAQQDTDVEQPFRSDSDSRQTHPIESSTKASEIGHGSEDLYDNSTGVANHLQPADFEEEEISRSESSTTSTHAHNKASTKFLVKMNADQRLNVNRTLGSGSATIHDRIQGGEVVDINTTTTNLILDNALVGKSPVHLLQEMCKLLTPEQISRFNAGALKPAEQLSAPIIAAKSCAFLDRLPREVRDQIYGYLLFNPALGDGNLRFCQRECGAKSKFGLHHAVLQACKQTYREGCSILYGQNTFTVFFNEDRFHCALVRWRRGEPMSWKGISSLSKIRHWRLLVTRRAPKQCRCNNGNEIALGHFCEEIRLNPPQTLEMVMLPQGLKSREYEEDSSELAGSLTRRYFPRTMLSPLQVLRNVGRLSFKEGLLQYPESFGSTRSHIPSTSLLVSTYPRLAYKEWLPNLVEGNQPVEVLFDMYAALLHYARCFERDPQYKEDMDRLRTRDYQDGWKYGDLSNPYKWPKVHILEELLEYTKNSSIDYEVEDFKVQRIWIMRILERQFKKIAVASQKANAFDNNAYAVSGARDGFLRDRGIVHRVLLIKDYAASFSRELTTEVRISIEALGKRFENRYKQMPREINLHKMGLSQEKEDRTECGAYIEVLLADMNSQFSAMKEAHKAVFVHDLETGSRYDNDEWKCEQFGHLDQADVDAIWPETALQVSHRGSKTDDNGIKVSAVEGYHTPLEISLGRVGEWAEYGIYKEPENPYHPYD